MQSTGPISEERAKLPADVMAKIEIDNDLRSAFGARLKDLRKKNGWTMKDVAAKIDVRFEQLNRYEGGGCMPPVEKLLLLAEVYGASVDFLLTGDGSSEAKPLHNLRLLDRFRKVQEFSPHTQETVIELIDAMILKERVHLELEASRGTRASTRKSA